MTSTTAAGSLHHSIFSSFMIRIRGGVNLIGVDECSYDHLNAAKLSDEVSFHNKKKNTKIHSRYDETHISDYSKFSYADISYVYFFTLMQFHNSIYTCIGVVRRPHINI